VRRTLESQVKSIISKARQEYFQLDISGIVIGVTGDKPFQKDNITDLITKLDGIVHKDVRRQEPKYIVVGKEDYDEEYLRVIVEKNIDGVLYLTQETFFDRILFGAEVSNSYTREEITAHPGLSFIDECTPSSPFATQDDLSGFFKFGQESGSTQWNKKSFLRNYGYHTGLYPEKRRECLRAAVKGQGLPAVVNFISWLIERPTGNDVTSAINIWRKDLEWLEDTYGQC